MAEGSGDAKQKATNVDAGDNREGGSDDVPQQQVASVAAVAHDDAQLLPVSVLLLIRVLLAAIIRIKFLHFDSGSGRHPVSLQPCSPPFPILFLNAALLF